MRSPCLRGFSFVLGLFFLLAALPVVAQNNRPVPGVYRGSQQCIGCHSETLGVTAHLKTMEGPEGILTTTIDGQTVSVFDPRTPGYDKFVRPYEAFFNPLNVLYTIGGHGWMQRFVTRIAPVSGDATDPREAALLPLNDTVIMGAQWNQRKERWEDFHGPTGDDTWTANSFNTKCGSCHSTGLQAKDYSRLVRWVDLGITCEACHGPSSEINPITLRAKQANEVCGSCHTRGVSKSDDFEFPWNETLGGVFRPKQPLDSFVEQSSPSSVNFWPDGESRSHHQQWPDLQLSRHAAADVRCIDCHNPHKKFFPGQLRDNPLSLCLSCHSSNLLNSSDRLQHSKHTDSQASCIDCHMPRTASAVDPNDIRSHTFLMIEPQKTREFGILSGCVDCHTNGPGSPKSQAELERTFRAIAPSFRETALVPFPQDSDRWTGFALANLGTRAARLFFTLFDPDGRIFHSGDVSNPRVVMLEPGKQVASLVDEFFGGALAGSQGWVRLSHYEPNLKGFYLQGDDAFTELTGLTAEGALSQMWVTPVLWPGSNSRVSLTNLSPGDASVILIPMSPGGSQAGAPLATAIPARGRRNFEIQPLFPSLPAGGYLCVQSSVALQGQVTALQGKTLATLRLFAAGTGSNSLTIPHAVLGDGWETRLIFYNPMNHDVEIQIEMRRDGFGSAPFGEISRRTLAPGAMLNESLAAFVPAASSRVEGYLLVKTSDSADRVQSAVSFGSLSGGAVAALSADGAGRRSMTFSHVAQGNGYWTGLALLAPGGGAATVELYADDGKLLQSREVGLNERRVATLNQLLPVGDVRGGYIRVRSGVDMFAFELFGNDRVSILAAVPPQ